MPTEIELLKRTLPFLEESKSSTVAFISILFPKDRRKEDKQKEVKEIDKLINQIKAKIKELEANE